MLWIRLLTWFKGKLVGQDDLGNRYYQEKGLALKMPRRWVVYKGIPEPSKVPPEWNSWLQYTRESPPSAEILKRRLWEKKHLPNLTGTPYAYKPEEVKIQTIQGYTAWRPGKGTHENKST